MRHIVMTPLVISILFSFLVAQLGYAYELKSSEEADMIGLVLSQGYPLEVHEIETEDGYILTSYRIPYGKNSTATSLRGQPVIVQHGILCCSAAWVLGNPKQALGFILADQGYDVWLTNSRGSTFSRKHAYLDPTSAEFWDFSFHEMGYYDLPATIDYVLEKTNETKLYFIGHSQGTSQFFAMAAARPEYNDKIRHMSAMAPIAFLDHTRGTVRVLGALASILEKIARLLNLHHVLDQSFILQFIERTACNKKAVTISLCSNILFLLAGYDSQELNLELIPLITKYTPAGASIKQLLHYGQLLNNQKKFSLYDYGSFTNLMNYGQEEPPEYDVGKITAPVMLHYAYNDWISGVEDVDRLYKRLANSRKMVVPFSFFNHLDFMWARDAWELIYKDLIDEMSKY